MPFSPSTYHNYSIDAYILTYKITSKIIHANGLLLWTESLQVVIPKTFDAKTFKDLASECW